MDLGITDNLDLLAIDKEYKPQTNGETTLLQAFFSDARVGNQRGYWLDDVLTSDIWQYDQKRLTDDTINDLNETAKKIAKELVNIGLYDKIDTKVFSNDNVVTLHLTAYNQNQIVFDRKFAI